MFIVHDYGNLQETYYLSFEELRKIGNSLFLNGKLAEAKNIFTGILIQKPNDAEAHYELSKILWYTDKREEGNKHHHQAISIKLNEHITRCNNSAQELQDLIIHHNNKDNIEITGNSSNTQFDNDKG